MFVNIIEIGELELYNNQDRNRDVIDKEVRRAKFRLLGLLGQGYNIITYIYRLPGYTKIFKELAGRIILIDNYIR